MNTLVNFDGRTLDITHITVQCANPCSQYAAEHPMLSILQEESGYNIIVFRTKYGSGEMVIASECHIPENMIDLFLTNVVPITSERGKELYSFDSSRC